MAPSAHLFARLSAAITLEEDETARNFGIHVVMALALRAGRL